MLFNAFQCFSMLFNAFSMPFQCFSLLSQCFSMLFNAFSMLFHVLPERLARQRGHRHRWAWPPTPAGAQTWPPTPVDVATHTGWRADVATDTGEPVHVEPCAWRRAPAWRAAPAPRNLDLTARTYLDARTASLDAHPSPQNAISKDHLCHIPIARGKGTARDATRRATRDAAEDYWCSRRPASGGTSSHARTQLRLASPRPLARTHETDTISRLDSPPTSDTIRPPCG